MPNLNTGSKTYRNLKDAFGIESEASCRYLYFARPRISRACARTAVWNSPASSARVGNPARFRRTKTSVSCRTGPTSAGAA
jgi:hypothetical protein